MNSDLVWSRAQVIRSLHSEKVAGIAATGLTIRFVLSGGTRSGYLASSAGVYRAHRALDDVRIIEKAFAQSALGKGFSAYVWLQIISVLADTEDVYPRH